MKKNYCVIAVYVTAIALSVIGCIFIYSASCYGATLETGDKFFYVKKQVIALVLGVFCMFLIRLFNLETLKKLRYPLLILGYILLALVFVPVIGVESYGAKRWLNLGFFTIQPSEYAKFFLVVFLSAFMSEKDMKLPKNIFLALFCGLLMCFLIILEPNMSITVCVGAVIMIMLFVGGIKNKHILMLVVPVLVALPILIAIEPYRLKRIVAFIDPWANPRGEGYQLIQSYYALGSGGWFGLGLFNSRQKYLYLPFSESDFILSVIGEEMGFVGVMILLSIFLIYIVCGFKISANADTRFKSYLAMGITSVVAVQTALNFAVVSGTIPPTGLPLPFVSAGGSSLVAFLVFTGILCLCDKKDDFYQLKSNTALNHR